MARAAVNGIDVYYERSGDGPPLLFLNGTGQTIANSRLSVAPFAERFDVIVADQRGLGETEVPAGPATMADFAADSLALLDHLGIDRVRVVGTSFGGMVAQELAVTEPGRVLRLALLCTSAGGPGGSSYPLEQLMDLPVDQRRARGLELVDRRWTEAWLADHDLDRMIADALTSSAPAEAGSDRARGQRAQIQARAGHDVWDRLPSITAPTLVAAGRYDGIAPVANAEAIAARIPGAVLRVFEGGHTFTFQDPTAVPEITGFLAG